MSNIRRTAQGSAIDIDRLRLANETTIAVGNSKTNARGDQLGPGGKIIKTRAQIMAEYHQTNAIEEQIEEDPYAEQVAEATTEPAPLHPQAESNQANTNKPRGSFADAVAQTTEVNQELLTPASQLGKPSGPQRL